MAVNRETVNVVRFVLENLIPPALRDSVLFLPLMYLAWGKDARRVIAFRERVGAMTDAEYASYYARLKPLTGETDLNRACARRVLDDAVGRTLLDAGCGRGWLARHLAEADPGRDVVGVDIAPPDNQGAPANLGFLEGWLGRLPFADRSFDTVICAHTLEHVADLDGALADLRRIARLRLIIVVPRERETRYPLNLHVHFFPYRHSFLNRIRPPEGRFACEVLNGDIYYCEDMA